MYSESEWVLEMLGNTTSTSFTLLICRFWLFEILANTLCAQLIYCFWLLEDIKKIIPIFPLFTFFFPLSLSPYFLFFLIIRNIHVFAKFRIISFFLLSIWLIFTRSNTPLEICRLFPQFAFSLREPRIQPNSILPPNIILVCRDITT